MKTEQFIRQDKRYIWHPFTPMSSWLSGTPLIIASAQGAELTDTEGRSYIDAVSSLWTNVHGHRVEKIDQAIRRQLEQMAHSTLLGLGNVPSIRFAAALAPHLPGGLERIFYSDNGATAVEIALKLAYCHRRFQGKGEKVTFIRFEGAYHGDTIGSVSVGGIDLFHGLFRPLLFEAPVASYPFCYRCPWECAPESCNRSCFDRIEAVIRDNAHRSIGVIIEPLVQGASGIRPAPSGFLTFLREMCTKYDQLLIVDEVATGFGRTGKMFACEHEGVVPDLMAMAKGISGGYLPLAATAVDERIFASFLDREDEFRTFFHGHTYTGNPLACAAARASLELFENPDFFDRLETRISLVQARLEALSEHPHVGHVRNVGMMAGIEIVENKESRKPFAPDRRIGAKLCDLVREQGVILRPLGDVMVVMPPLCVKEEQIHRIFDAIVESLQQRFGC